MNNIEINKMLVKLIMKIFPNKEIDENVIEYADFIDDLGMDSITFVTLIIEIEDLFGIVIPDELITLENFKNLNEITRIIQIVKID